MNLRLFYEVHKSKFKIGIIILLAVAAISIIVFKFLSNPERNIPFYTKPQTTTISSTDNNFTISYSNNYNLTQKKSNNYVLALENDEDFLITVTKNSKDFNFSLEKILSSDRDSFLSSLENYKETTAITTTNFNNISGVSYTIVYKYKSIDYVIIEFLTEINNNLYFFDVRYPKALQEKYVPITNELLNSITIK